MPRTLVNRIWAKLMGHGLVPNVDDMDGEPWSPELLDWMSSDFVASGYDLKHLIANIISSRTYQLPVVAETANTPAAKEYVFRGPEERAANGRRVCGCCGLDYRGLACPNGRRQSGCRNSAGRLCTRLEDGGEQFVKIDGPAPPGPGLFHAG